MPYNVNAAGLLRDLLVGFPEVRVSEIGPVGMRRLRLTHGDTAVTVLPVWAGEGFPDDVRRALLEENAVGDGDAVLVVAAEKLSTGSRRRLEDADISWVDRTGARISAPPVFIAVDRGQGAAPAERRSVWNGTAAAVAETVLVHRIHNPNGRLETLADLAGHTGRAVAGVSRALTAFDAAGWTQKDGAARGPGAVRRLTEPGGLLSAWSAWHRDRKMASIAAHAIFRDPEDYVRGVVSALPSGTWCLTGWLAAQRSVPVATTVERVSLYVASELFDDPEELLGSLHARRVSRGARLEILRADPHVIAQASTRDPSSPVASAVRIHGDLLRETLRGAEAAQQWRERVIGF